MPAYVAAAHHPRLRELLEELGPELAGRGFTRNRTHPLWAADIPHGLRTTVLSYAPDDEEGGWIEPFIGLIDERVETLVATHTNTPVTHGLRHTLIIGATRWLAGPLQRQPAHSTSEVLEATNVVLRWLQDALPAFSRRFVEGDRLAKLDELFNTESEEARRYLSHDLYRALRGLSIRSLYHPEALTDATNFHRARMLDTGFWEAYGDQVLAFAAALS